MARVLLIDDEVVMRSVLLDILQDAGHDVTELPAGDQAEALYKAAPYDLVITDLFMPDKEGMSTIVGLKNAFPGIKIIAISGGGSDLLKMARLLGAAKCLAKPISREDLLEAVNDIIAPQKVNL